MLEQLRMSSSAATTTVKRLPRPSSTPPSDPLAFRVLKWGVAAPVILALAVLIIRHWHELEPLLGQLGTWLVLVALADLMPVPYWGRVSLTMSLPILLAAGIIYEPWTAGLLAFLGSIDPREFRRRLGLDLALFNRGQIALAAMGASAVFHLLGGRVIDWPLVLPIALAALLADASINFLAVVIGGSISERLPPRRVLSNLFGGSAVQFAIGYASFGLLGLLLATVYHHVGAWGLISFIVPLVLARQMFQRGQQLMERSKEVVEKGQVILRLTDRIAAERRDERMAVAASLHDEVLQPLYKVHLMAKVLRHDVDSGRLLDLDEDIPELLRAADAAMREARGVIKNLRTSALGAGGLIGTLRLLMDELSLETEARIEEDIRDVGGSPLVQLLLYQVAKEALLNAVRHAAAHEIVVHLSGDSDCIRLVVEDDGIGISTGNMEADDHFGIRLMRERVESAGGTFVIDATPGLGTRVVARVPCEVSLEKN
jgi:signal transduction histidine kinase